MNDDIDYLSFLILGIILGVFTVIVINVKKYYYKISEQTYADRMQEYLFKIQNGLNNEDVLEIKQKMKDLDESQRIELEREDAESGDKFGLVGAFMDPTDIVKQVNSKLDSGVSKITGFSSDVYDEYVKPVLYKMGKMVGW
jgi:cell division protein YceG involved in septum cleavage